MTGKKIGVAFFFAAIITQAGAQELGIELNGGLQGLYYPLKIGQSKLLPAGSLGLNYTFRLGSHVGLLTGVTGGLYRTQATLQDGHIFTFGEVDDAGSAFQYRMKFTGYKETQHFFAASIPLLLQYHTGGAGTQWYLNGGAKLFIPFNVSAQVSAQQASLTGYYPDFNVEVSDLPEHGFGTLNNWNSSATAKLRSVAVISGGTGMIFRLSPGKSLYTGLFVDIGLTALKDENNSLSLVTYSPKGINGARANSVLNTENAGQVKLHSYGLQIRLSFGSPRTKSVARPATKEEPPPAVGVALSDEDTGIIHEPVVFGVVGGTSIPEAQKPHLDEVANLLKRYPGIRLSIAGHYCNSETETESKKVGEARAKAVARYLQDKGISRNRMDVGAAAEGDPVVPGDPGANYYNRRVVITVK